MYLSLKPFTSKVHLRNSNFWSTHILLLSTKITSSKKHAPWYTTLYVSCDPSPKQKYKGSETTLDAVLYQLKRHVSIICSDTYHNIIVHILNEDNVLYRDFVLMQGPLHNIIIHLMAKHIIINVGIENFMKIEMQCENIVFCLIPSSLNTQKN
jgi:hypothetical protein